MGMRMTRLRYLRLKRRLSLRQLARRSGVLVPILQLTEAGRCQPWRGTLSRLAEALEWQEEPEKLLEEIEIGEEEVARLSREAWALFRPLIQERVEEEAL